MKSSLIARKLFSVHSSGHDRIRVSQSLSCGEAKVPRVEGPVNDQRDGNNEESGHCVLFQYRVRRYRLSDPVNPLNPGQRSKSASKLRIERTLWRSITAMSNT